MQNFVQPGKIVDLTAPSGGVVSGKGYKIGAFVGIASNTIAQGLPFPLAVEGVFDADAEGAGSGQAWAEGDQLYWDDTNSRFTKTSTGNTIAAIACTAKVTTAVTGRLKLVPKAG